jgi:hypothetical protein
VPRAYVLRPDDATLAPAAVELASRGERMFGELFSEPYGTQAHSAFERQDRERPGDVFGLSATETQRVERLLEEIAGASRVTRQRWGTFLLVTSLVPLGGLALELGTHRYHAGVSEYVVLGGLGALFAGLGISSLLTPSKGEEAYAALRPHLSADGRVQRAAFLQASETLAALDKKMRRSRRIEGGVMLGAGLGAGAVCAYEWLERGDRVAGIASAAAGFALLTMAGFHAFTLSSEERLIRLYQRDPQLSLQLGANLSRYSAELSLRGRF